MKNVFIVYGAPGSGKSTFVKEHKAPDDLVIDLDYICAALMQETEIYIPHDSVLRIARYMRDSVYPMIAMRAGEWNDCYIITSESREIKINELAMRLKATSTILMDIPLEECLNRIENDNRRGKRREEYKQLARGWYLQRNEAPPIRKK